VGGGATKNLNNLLGKSFNDKLNNKRLDNKKASLELQDLSNIYD
jgi:hypothetical protein